MAGWNGLSSGARAAVLLGGAAVVAALGYLGFARGPQTVAPVDQVAVDQVAADQVAADQVAADQTAGDAAAVSGAEAPAVAAETAPAATEASPAAAIPEAAAAAAPQAATPQAAAPQAETPQAAAPADAVAVTLPRFDVARVAPDGAATVAGAAAPGAVVSVLLDGVEVAQAVADGQGKFAALFDVPPSPVARLLSLRAKGADGLALQGTETVALAPVVAAVDVAVAGTGAAVLQAPATVLVAPEGVKVLQPGAQMPAEMAGNVALDSISYAPDGAVRLGGRAQPGAALRIYLDGAAIADVAAGPDAAWVATLNDVAAGIYTLRVDQLGADGKVTSRFETPFKRETLAALAATAAPAVLPDLADTAADSGAEPSVASPQTVVAPDVAAADGAPAPVVAATPEAAPKAADTAAAVPEAAAAPAVVVADTTAAVAAKAAPTPAPVSVTVQPGYTLWGIAQQNFGEGVMYVQVFEANKDKIIDPDLIYPGQVFTIPAAP